MSGSTYDSNGTVTVTSLLDTVTAIVTHDSLTPAGQVPVVSMIIDLTAAGAVNLIAENGAVADVTGILGLAGALNVLANDATVNLEPSTVGLLSGTVLEIENGGIVNATGTFLGVLDGSAVTFGSGTGTLNFNSDGTLINLDIAAPITGFKSGDVISDQDLPLASIGSYAITNPLLSTNQTVTFYSLPNGGGSVLGVLTFAPSTFSGFTLGKNYNTGTGPLQLVAGPGGVVSLAVCFLRGTHIAVATPDGGQGEIRVEDLQVGDQVATLCDGEWRFKPVTWIGSRTMFAARDAADDAFPVRIRAGAFAENMPQRDLLVTPEHCVFVHGKLVPARMLVNGGSIIVDRGISIYSYYHVELAAHSVLLAEGLPTESYLDTGNRGNFSNAPVPALQPDFTLHASHDAWRELAAAPLGVAREFVQPIWQALAARAAMLGMRPAAPDRQFTDEPDLHLVAECGMEIRPVLAEGDTYAFLVPGNARNLRIRSRTARPSDIVGPFVDDRRALGVRVGRIALGIGRKRMAVETHLSDQSLPGWHAPEAKATGRWTDGEATLPIDLAALNGRPVFLDIQVLQAGPYAATVEEAGPRIAVAA